MCTVGQDEVVIVLECTAEETNVPRDIFTHLHNIYDDANRGMWDRLESDVITSHEAIV